MQPIEFAAEFARADEAARQTLLSLHSDLPKTDLARALMRLCVDAWGRDPSLVLQTAGALERLYETENNREICALRDWSRGYAALVGGRMRDSVAHLNRAAENFEKLDLPHDAAQSQILKLYPLASLNRFDEAIATGLKTREILLAHDDLVAVGKVELNVGNLYWQRDRFAEAEKFYRSARERFLAAADEKLLTQAENSLAFVLGVQNRFRAAEEIYQTALPRAERNQLSVTQAEIESSLGFLALAQSRYDQALDFLERARRHYAALAMPHRSAIAELEIADAYLELNLAREAAEIYERVAPVFAASGTTFEQAHALVNRARALVALGKNAPARENLDRAAALYADCQSASGAGTVALIKAQLEFAEKNYREAKKDAARAEAAFERLGIVGKRLFAQFLRAEAARHANEDSAQIEQILRAALAAAEANALPQISWRCLTSLGLLAAAAHDAASAEKLFKRAALIVETLRAPLPAEEFRQSFFADKLEPYTELARLCLEDSQANRVAEAFEYVELARARALVEMIEAKISPVAESLDESAAGLQTLREELNWFYSLLNRRFDSAAEREAVDFKQLDEEIRRREAAVAEIMRQTAAHRNSETNNFDDSPKFDLKALQRDLGAETVFVEYAVFGGRVAAFVVDRENVNFIGDLGDEGQIAGLIKNFRFQIDALRYGSREIRRHLYDLTLRTREILSGLYQILLKPLEHLVGLRRLVVAPHRVLHYVPFQALYDGVAYAIERREIVVAPSAAAWQAASRKPARELRRALLVGFADESIPRVEAEIEKIAVLFDAPEILTGARAAVAAVRTHAAAANVLHLACHGQFRRENPLFSALKLADGWLTVRDAARLDLKNCGLAVLSACETGLSEIAPGDELLGLMRGFLAAGAPAIVLSQWTVDDEATAFLMTEFYQRLKKNQTPAAALRAAQLATMRRRPHPFFWASFALAGRA